MSITNDETSKIKSVDNFVEFLKNLANDFHEKKNDWQNWDIDAYLKAVAAWIEDSKRNQKMQSSFGEIKNWKMLADIFLAGKLYE